MGEEVHYSDQVKLESVATEGQFLHCSKKTFGDSEVQINVNKEWLVLIISEMVDTHFVLYFTAMKST